METSVTSVEAGLTLQTVVLPPDQEEALTSDPERENSDPVDPMEEFTVRLSDIILHHGAAQALVSDDKMADVESDVSTLLSSLDQLVSTEDKLEDLLQRFTRLSLSQQQQQGERRSSEAARVKLESLCRDLISYFGVVREEALQRHLEDADKRDHFQKMLSEIQTQIQTHSTRNDKLCLENSNLSQKLQTLMNQCEQRDQSVEKMDKHHELQLKLTQAKLQQAEAQLSQTLESHKREKEYLLREAIEKTKKCFTMKEQELNMKKKLTLYAQKFDEFQETLAKSNEIYLRFKKEMENMSEKMKTLEKESNVWKTRFENCNKALNDMMQERTERGNEYDVFVLKITKLENLCRALQEERKGLYSKIKEVQESSSGSSRVQPKTSEQTEKVIEVQEADPVLTDNMVRLREEQLKLQELADSLLAPPAAPEGNEDLDLNEDLLASAFIHFQDKTPTTSEILDKNQNPEPPKSSKEE